MTWPGLSFVKQVKVIYNKQDYVLREDLIPKHTLQRPFLNKSTFMCFEIDIHSTIHAVIARFPNNKTVKKAGLLLQRLQTLYLLINQMTAGEFIDIAVHYTSCHASCRN